MSTKALSLRTRLKRISLSCVFPSLPAPTSPAGRRGVVIAVAVVIVWSTGDTLASALAAVMATAEVYARLAEAARTQQSAATPLV